MHGGPRLAGHGLGHEGRVHIVLQGRFAQRALEEEDLVGQAQRVAVQEVDFHLPGADFVDQGVDVQVHQFAVIVDILEQRVEFIDGVDAVHLAAGLGPAAAADGRLQRQVGVRVFRRQVELQLRRHHGLPALVRIQFQHAPQHRSGSKIDQRAIGKIAVVDDLRGGICSPWHHGDGGGIGFQDHVAVGAGNGAVIAAIVDRVIARHGHAQHRLRDAHAALLGEFPARQDLPARHTRQVGDQAFDFRDALFIEPQIHIRIGEIFAYCHVSLSLVLRFS